MSLMTQVDYLKVIISPIKVFTIVVNYFLEDNSLRAFSVRQKCVLLRS